MMATMFKWCGVILFACLIGLICFQVYGYFQLESAATRFQKEVGKLDPSDYSPARIVETENGAIVLQGGAYAVVMTTDERTFLRLLIEKPLQSWDEASTTRARGITQRNEAAYQVMARSIPQEKSNFNLKYSMSWDMPIPNYLYFMQARSLLGARARLSLIEGNTVEALNTMAVQERMAAALLHEPVVISCLIGQAVQKDYDALVQEVLHRFDVAGLHTIDSQMRHLQSMAVPLSMVLAADGSASYLTLSRRYPTEEGSQISQDLQPRLFYRMNRRLFLADLLNYYADVFKDSQVPYVNQSEKPAGGMIDKTFAGFHMRELIGRFQSVNSEMQLARSAVKIVLEAKEKGAYPKNLSVSPPQTSPYSGEKMQYTISSEGHAQLSYPEADRFWDRTQKDAVPKKPLFIWKLPVVASTP